MLKVNNVTVHVGRFPDSTPLIHPPVVSHGDDIVISWKYENDSEMSALMFIKRHYERVCPGAHIALDMPYIPNARQDRVKSAEDVFTLKYFAEFINWLGFDSVRVLDPHSSVSEALFDNLVILSPKKYIESAIKAVAREAGGVDLIAFFPDEGAMKRYSSQAELPYAFGVKMRDWQTGKIQGLSVMDNGVGVAGKNVIIIDDISSKGGTFYHSAKKLRELGAGKIYLYVTHCEKTIFKGEVFSSELIEKVFTTDSIFTAEVQKFAKENGLSEKIEVLPL